MAVENVSDTHINGTFTQDVRHIIYLSACLIYQGVHLLDAVNVLIAKTRPAPGQRIGEAVALEMLCHPIPGDGQPS